MRVAQAPSPNTPLVAVDSSKPSRKCERPKNQIQLWMFAAYWASPMSEGLLSALPDAMFKSPEELVYSMNALFGVHQRKRWLIA